MSLVLVAKPAEPCDKTSLHDALLISVAATVSQLLSQLGFSTMGRQSWCRWHGEVAHQMVEDIKQVESKAERSLMHRFNLAKVSRSPSFCAKG